MGRAETHPLQQLNIKNMKANKRFTRLPKGEAFGFKIATRKDINKKLSDFDAYDIEQFLASLKFLFGEPDNIVDNTLSYSIFDNKTMISFVAYSGNSGPAYGGGIYHFEDIKRGKLLPEVLESLLAFDLYLISSSKNI